jgi:hypothetical protein
MTRKHTIATLLNDPKSRRRILDRVKAGRGGGLFDLIPPVGEPPLGSEKELYSLGMRPQPEEIDHSQTSSEMILSRKAVLKDGRRRRWLSYY